MSIPKTIHYCWFGPKSKPKLVEACIESWYRVLPDYEIKEWNETNSDLSSRFVQEMLQQKKWAFVSDYVRLQVLYSHGGIYLDTDMCFVRPIDDLLDAGLFFGAEEKRFVSCGIIASKPEHPFLKDVIDYYDNVSLDQVRPNEMTIPKIVTPLFRSYFDFDGEFGQLINRQDTVVYPIDYFYPFSLEDAEKELDFQDFIKADTYAVHLWNKSWVDYSEFHYFKRRQYWMGLMTAIRNLRQGSQSFNYKYLKKLGYSLKRSIFKS